MDYTQRNYPSHGGRLIVENLDNDVFREVPDSLWFNPVCVAAQKGSRAGQLQSGARNMAQRYHNDEE